MLVKPPRKNRHFCFNDITKDTTMKLTWYFDFISPFAYLQYCHFDRLPQNTEVELKPILFSGLLNHWKNVGPAEIAPKRIFTYKHCYWMAKKRNIAFKMPPAHPFNSLSALRLAIACNNHPQAIQIIFETIWKDGLEFVPSTAIEKINSEIGITNLVELVDDNDIKIELRKNTEEAAQNDVFGVPTFIPKDAPHEKFWGLDAFDMLLDYIEYPTAFRDSEMQRIEVLPEGIQRKR
jgi:2-hydroxychromene-2-carboxylate isomerase